MHEKMKSFLEKTGTTHSPGNPSHEEHGMINKEMHEIEGKHLEGKRHHHDLGM